MASKDVCMYVHDEDEIGKEILQKVNFSRFM